jgi:hypothetical protein
MFVAQRKSMTVVASLIPKLAQWIQSFGLQLVFWVDLFYMYCWLGHNSLQRSSFELISGGKDLSA